jgi:hypothetical protein
LKRLKLIKHKSKTGKEIYGENMPISPGFPYIPLYLLLPYILYSLLILRFGVKKNDKPVEAAGWLGLAVTLAYSFFPSAGLVFLIFFAVYFFGTLIWLSIKYGNEPLWKSKASYR